MLLSMLFFLEQTYVATDAATTIVGVMFGLTVAVLAFQYLFLGNRVAKLLRENAFIAANIHVLLDGMKGGSGARVLAEEDGEG